MHSTPQRITLVESPTDTPQGVTMDMDSYQPTTEAQLPPRKRRPWWRWNLITLAIVLFVLLWSRELLQFDPSSAWLMAATIFFLWAIVPMPWAMSSFTIMADVPKETLKKRDARCKAVTIACRLLAFFLAIVSICNAMVIAYQISTTTMFGGFQMLFYTLPIAAQFSSPLFQLALAAVLWLLAETLEKLAHVANELRVRAERQDKEASE